jgi:hypothetical protein
VIPHLEHWRQRLGRSRPTPLLGRDATRIVRDFPSLDKVASVIDFWNDHLDAREAAAADYEHVVVEVPRGRPQLEFFEQGDQWVPRGHLLRCVVMGSNGEPDEPFLTIDDRDFTPREFARMVGTFGGWGMRISFVPDDQVYEEPVVEVREPDPKR